MSFLFALCVLFILGGGKCLVRGVLVGAPFLLAGVVRVEVFDAGTHV